MNLSVQRAGTVDAGLEAPGDTRAESGRPTLPPIVLALQRVGMPTLRIAALLFPIAFMIVGFQMDRIFADPTTIGSDSSNYYAAGQRLNAGHPLYILSAGDRAVPIVPPYWSTPLLAPPPIAVLWRGIALLGDTSMWLWWLASIGSVLATVVLFARRGSGRALIAVILLSPSLGLTAVSGNANAFLLSALVAAWLWRDRGPAFAGSIAAAAAAIKLSPAIFSVWFLLRPTAAGRRSLVGFVGAGVAISLLSLAGAGLQSHLDYLAAARNPANGAPTPLSLPGLLAGAGAPAGLAGLAIPILIAVGLGLAFGIRRRERASFAALAVTAALATPVVYFQTIALLLVAVAPWLREVGHRDSRMTA